MSRIHPRYCFIVDPQAGYKHTVCIRGALSVSKCESDKQKAANVVISLVYLTQVCVCGLAKKLYFYVSHKESTVREKIAGCIEEGFIQKARQTVVVSVWGARLYATLGIFGLSVRYCVHSCCTFPFTFLGGWR